MLLVETSVFTRRLLKLLNDELYRQLQHALVADPERGDLIRGSGGLRKLRWPAFGRGKRGGVRIIYYWAPDAETILLLLVLCEERERRPNGAGIEALTKVGGTGIQMKSELIQDLVDSIKEGGAILRGKVKARRSFEFREPDVRAIRAKLGLSQDSFSVMLGISPATLRNWEQNRRKPGGAARVLLRVAEKHPKAVLDAVHS